MKWFYQEDEREIGPLSETALRELQHCGAVSSETLVRREDSEGWVRFDGLLDPESDISSSRGRSPEPELRNSRSPEKSTMTYYIVIGTEVSAPLTVEKIRSLVANGTASRTTRACIAGSTEWAQLELILPEVFNSATVPGAGAVALERLTKAGGLVTEHGSEMASLTKVFARRILRSNFVIEHALPAERAALESASIPVHSPMAQNYAAWRRAMLWFSGIGLAVAAIVQVVNSFSSIFGAEGEPTILRLIFTAFTFFLVLAPVLVIRAARRWQELRASRRLARLAWFSLFFGPLLLCFVPLKLLLSKSEYGSDGLATMGVVYAMFVLAILLPRVFGLFPGILRACLTMRTLVPESPMPGWVCAVLAPLYCLMFAIMVAIALQVGPSLVFYGLLGLLAAPVILFTEVRRLSRPMATEEMNVHVRAVRVRMAIANSIGLVLLLSAASDLFEKVTMLDLASTVCQLIGNIFLLTLVASDFFLGLMKLTFDEDNALRRTPLYAQLEQRFADLAQVRLTDLRDNIGPPPPA